VRPAAHRDRAAPRAIPAELVERDLRGLAWWVVGGVLSRDLAANEATVIASLLRVLAALGPAEASTAAALREVELRGRIMHGQPPRDAVEWELASSLFSDEALDEFRRWEALLEADPGDCVDPLLLGE
jgi:hypothetical protein